jgi:hypothetical protein
MAQTFKEQTTPRGADKRTRGPATLTKLERDLKAYELTLAGVTVRGVCEELGISSTQTAFNAINRGKEYCIERGIPCEERRIEIDKLFKQTLGLLVKTAYDQDAHGQIETIHGPDGTIVKTRKGVDPRIVGELSRSLNRWAEFCGLLERAPEVNQATTTLIQLATPADGASFTDRWGSGETVEISASAHESAHVSGMTPAEPAPALDGATVYNAVAPAQGELL